jgi:hypothetical protein
MTRRDRFDQESCAGASAREGGWSASDPIVLKKSGGRFAAQQSDQNAVVMATMIQFQTAG